MVRCNTCCLLADTIPDSRPCSCFSHDTVCGLGYRPCAAGSSSIQGTDRTGSGKQVTHAALLVNHTPTELHSLLASQSELDRAGLAGGEESLACWVQLMCWLTAAAHQPRVRSQLTSVSRVFTQLCWLDYTVTCSVPCWNRRNWH